LISARNSTPELNPGTQQSGRNRAGIDEQVATIRWPKRTPSPRPYWAAPLAAAAAVATVAVVIGVVTRATPMWQTNNGGYFW
jgi:hypothetical protein